MPQFDPQTDSIIENWTEALDNEVICPTCHAPRGFIPLQAYAKQQFDGAWEKLNQLFDHGMGSAGKAARFITRHGYTFSREVTDPEERLQPEVLEMLIERERAASHGPNIWEMITDPVTTRVLNQTKLARVISAGLVTPEQIKAATIKPEPVASRHRRKTTKDDAIILAAIGTPPAEASAEKAG